MATLAIMPSAIIILLSFTFSSSIIKRFGAMNAMILAASTAASGMLLMALAWIGWPIFIAGVYLLASSAFGLVVYIQYIAARVDPGRMGAVQAGIASFVKLGFIGGTPFFTALNIALEKDKRWLSFFVGSIIAALSCCLLYCTLGRNEPTNQAKGEESTSENIVNLRSEFEIVEMTS